MGSEADMLVKFQGLFEDGAEGQYLSIFEFFKLYTILPANTAQQQIIDVMEYWDTCQGGRFAFSQLVEDGYFILLRDNDSLIKCQEPTEYGTQTI